MTWPLVCCVGLSLALLAPPVSVPDFSGRWKIDAAKSTAFAREAKGQASPVLGEECVVTQTADTLSLQIAIDTLKVEAIYRLDGKPSHNLSPGGRGQSGIPIVSTARWVGDTLEITTKSESDLGGVTVPVTSLRRMWLTAEGDLAVERRGTPAQIVSDAWSVYQRMTGER